MQFENINVTTAPSVNFLEANTSAISIEELTVNCVVPTWANQELTISHQDFINTVHDAACNVFSGELINKPEIRVSHIVRGRIPSALGKRASELLESEKTQFYQRLAFAFTIPSIHETIDGQRLELCIGSERTSTTILSAKIPFLCGHYDKARHSALRQKLWRIRAMSAVTYRTHRKAVARVEYVLRTDIRLVIAFCIFVIVRKFEIEELPVTLSQVSGRPRISYQPVFIYRTVAIPITVAVYREDYRLSFVRSCIKLIRLIDVRPSPKPIRIIVQDICIPDIIPFRLGT